MADNKNSNTIPGTKEGREAAAAAERAAGQKYVSDVVARRAARFETAEDEASPESVRSQRAALLNSLIPETLVDEGINGNPQKPVDNPIPVRHNGEEPGEPDFGEDPEDVKIRPDVQEFVPQPEGHRVPKEAQLNGETGDGGVMPVESWERQGRQPADGETNRAPPVSSTDIDENGDNEVGRLVREHVANAEKAPVPDKSGENDPAPPQDVNIVDPITGTNATGAMLANLPLDPQGKEKGLKETADGTVIDAEGDKHLAQPEGHNDQGPTSEAKMAGESEKDQLERLREEYKAKFKKPANARWSAEHLQGLIDEKV